MSMSLNERNPNISRINIGTRASSANVVVPGVYFRKHSRIKNVWYVDGAAISKDNTNHLILKLQDNASTPVVYAAADTSDNAVVAVTPYAMALQSPDDADANHLEKDVPAGTMLDVLFNGRGTVVGTDAAVLVEWYPV